MRAVAVPGPWRGSNLHGLPFPASVGGGVPCTPQTGKPQGELGREDEERGSGTADGVRPSETWVIIAG